MPGFYYDDIQIGMKIQHKVGRTISEADNILFSALTMNTQPLHLDENFAKDSIFGQRIVNGIFTMGLVIGLTVSDLTQGTIVANLAYDNVRHPSPVFHGDTIYAETEIIDKRESKSKPNQGIVRMRQRGKNQRGEIILELERTVMYLKKPIKSL